MSRLPIIVALLTTLAGGDDPYCPAYPKPQRRVLEARLQLERSTHAMSMNLVQPRVTWSAPRNVDSFSGNVIDTHIFRKMADDGVAPAPGATDAEILRRLSLDVIGRIPSIERIQGFVADPDTTKRDKLIDELIASEAFVDYWTAFFANHFEVTSNYYYFVGIPGRNLFYHYLRDFVSRDRSYADVVMEMIASNGDSHEQGSLNFLVRGVQEGDPVQDTWDVLGE